MLQSLPAGVASPHTTQSPDWEGPNHLGFQKIAKTYFFLLGIGQEYGASQVLCYVCDGIYGAW